MAAVETRKEIRNLGCVVADEELETTVQRQREIYARRLRLEREFAEIRARFKAAIEQENENLAEVLEAIESRVVMRDVLCEVIYDFGMGSVSVRRLDCDEIIEARSMLDADRQAGLPFLSDEDPLCASMGLRTPTSADALIAAADRVLDDKKTAEAKITILRMPGFDGNGDVVEVAQPVRFPGEVDVSKETAGDVDWAQKKALALGPVVLMDMVKDCGFGKGWCARAEALTQVVETYGLTRELAAYHMGAWSKERKLTNKRNPFQAEAEEEHALFSAWASGWHDVHVAEGRIARTALSEAEQRADDASAQRDDRVGTEFEGDARVNENGVFSEIGEHVIAIPALTHKKFSARLTPVEASPGRWCYGHQLQWADGGQSGPASIIGPWFPDLGSALVHFGGLLERTLPATLRCDELFLKKLRAWTDSAMRAGTAAEVQP